jgi:hypothetical protein
MIINYVLRRSLAKMVVLDRLPFWDILHARLESGRIRRGKLCDRLALFLLVRGDAAKNQETWR